MSEHTKPVTLKLLGVIVDRARTKKVTDILKEDHVRFHFITLGEGTAGSEIMAFLGLNSIDKSLICCLEQENTVSGLMRKISERLHLRKPGKGIAFTTPISGINNAALQLIAKGAAPRGEDEKVETVKCVPKYDMILSVINQGHVDRLMEAAKAAGARGGTVLHGRKIGIEEDVKFFGISVQLEKDIVAILVNHEKKNEIMRAITQSCGMNTDAQGVVIALPVDEIEGLGSVKAATEGE
ncbi:MAG: hypothetical protein LBQ56_02970 [Synergistaceae bacterium]|jgi:nitrogen regulatory protein PII|nr:hypothetical protein [Synergistaceae bacterium]